MQTIKLSGINRKYGGKQVLSNLTMAFEPGSTTAISGPSGCGKTTLLNIIAGLDAGYSGSVEGLPQKTAYMFQENRLLPWMSLKENIEFVQTDKDAAGIDGVLDMLELSAHQNKMISQLSGGMARRCALARALCYGAELLLLDEPFNGLDTELKLTIIKKLKAYFAEKNCTVIMVSHDLEAARLLGGEVITLKCEGDH